MNDDVQTVHLKRKMEWKEVHSSIIWFFIEHNLIEDEIWNPIGISLMLDFPRQLRISICYYNLIVFWGLKIDEKYFKKPWILKSIAVNPFGFQISSLITFGIQTKYYLEI